MVHVFSIRHQFLAKIYKMAFKSLFLALIKLDFKEEMSGCFVVKNVKSRLWMNNYGEIQCKK
jgi:hypothetical protein